MLMIFDLRIVEESPYLYTFNGNNQFVFCIHGDWKKLKKNNKQSPSAILKKKTKSF